MRAVVLSGEGAKGAFQAYVLSKLPFEPDFLVGVSSGAINAVGYSLLGPNGLLRFWNSIRSIGSVFRFNWQCLWQSGVYTTEPLKKQLRPFIKNPAFTFRHPVYFPVTCAQSGDTRWIQYPAQEDLNDSAVEMLMAAVTIPGLVRDDYGFIDGGVSTLCPLSEALRRGATEIHVILGRSPRDVPDFKPWRFLPFASYGYRFLDLVMHHLMMSDIFHTREINTLVKMNLSEKRVVNVKVYYPKRPLPDALAFKYSKAMANGEYSDYATLGL